MEYLADSFYYRKIFRKAAVIYLQAYKKNKSSKEAPQLILKASDSIYYLGNNKKACILIEELEHNNNYLDQYKSQIINAKNKFQCEE